MRESEHTFLVKCRRFSLSSQEIITFSENFTNLSSIFFAVISEVNNFSKEKDDLMNPGKREVKYSSLQFILIHNGF